tara:strand:+ start:2600 stop:3604 length:1005 start_codon:yes stop_codon:yes gene_type:complete
MILKSFLIEKNLSLIDNYNLILFYGENIGLKDEFKSSLKRKYNDHEKILFDQDEIIKNEQLINDQINNVSMFNDNKLIFINEISDKIFPKIEDIIEKPVSHIRLVLFANNLDKKSKLRASFEKNKEIGIIACYQDNHRTLSEYVREKLKDYSGVNQDIINLLINNSGLDRKVLFNEVEKIKSLFQNKKLDDVKINDLLNEQNNLNFDDLRDSCLEGNAEKLNKNLGMVSLQNENIFFYLNSLNQRIQKLLLLIEQNKKDKNIDYALNNLKPKVFWKDKPVILRQVKKWNTIRLEMAKKIILEAEMIMKTKMSNYNPILLKNLLVRIFKIANSTS